MAYESTKSTPDEQSKELNKLIAKSEHLSLFGTLTSLVSTGFLFVEQALGKKLPNYVNNAALATTGIGIGGVIASFYYRLKAGKIALYSTAHIGETPDGVDASPEPQKTEIHNDNAGQRKWATDALNAAPAQEAQR